MFTTVIFDLDGTLIDSLEDIADAVNFGLDKMGCPTHPLVSYKSFVGNGALKLCERALGKYADEEKTKILHEYFSSYYNDHCMDKTHPYPGITELVKTLKSNGIKLCAASNKPHEFTKLLIEKYFGRDTFSVIYGKQPSRPVKPDPAIIHDILNELNEKKENAVMIGDSNVDITTAVNAEISSIGCEWGFRTREELLNAGAENIVSAPEEILQIVKPQK